MNEIKKDGSSITVKPGIDLVASTADNCKAQLIALVEQDSPSGLVIDLDGVQMVDSAGISVLLSINEALEQKEGKLKVINTSEDIYGLFCIMNLNNHFEIGKSK